MTSCIYASAAEAIFHAGYAPLPLDRATKDGGIPRGFTGYGGVWPSRADVQTWIEDCPQHNVAARLPRECYGIDVDNYGGKGGAETLLRLEGEYCSLPPTWRVSSRFGPDYDGASGIRLFRLPMDLAAKADDPQAGWVGGWSGVDVIRFGHRFVVAPPSLHDKRLTPYRVLDESTGEIGDTLPPVSLLPYLPVAWTTRILHGSAGRERKDTAESKWWTEGRMCDHVAEALGKSRAELHTGRHDGTAAGVMRLTRLGEQGHPGVRRAIDTLHGSFLDAVTESQSGQRSHATAEAEWSRLVVGLDSRLTTAGLTPDHERGCRERVSLREWREGINLGPGADTQTADTARTSNGREDSEARRMVRLRTASEFRMCRTSWLWDERLPVGSLALLAGREGLGKSLLWVRLAADLTRGTLEGERFGVASHVVVVIGEDSPERTVAPRLRAAGADMERVHFAQVVTAEGVDGGLPVLPLDVALLQEAVENVGAVLVVCDPLVSLINGRIDTHRDNETRHALEPLSRLADATGSTVLGLVHHNKGGGDAGDRVIGSRAFVATARSVITVAPSQQDDSVRLASVTKSNLGRKEPDLPALAFRIRTVPLTADDGVMFEQPVLDWIGETSEQVSDSLSAGPLDSEERDERDALANFLRELVTKAGGEVTAGEAEKAIRAEFGNVSKSTLKRARARARIDTRKGGMDRGWLWFLDPRGEGATEGSEGSKEPTPGTFGTFVAPSEGEYGAHMGPCVGCGVAIRRYGEDSSGPLCEECRAAA